MNNVRISRCLFYVSDVLRQAYLGGTEVKDMSAQLKRSPGSIRDRLKKLGLME